jgi:hypothetical protein
LELWYKVATPRKEVREGRSFNPDEFAIALEQVVAGTAPEDYRDPEQFFNRTCFTRALREHIGMVLRRLSGKTENTAPVLTLVTQFGGGKTHTLASLYHLARSGEKSLAYTGVSDLLSQAGLSNIPKAKVAVFVGNAWDPQEGRENPWIDIARQLGGDRGVGELGKEARTTPPGTEALGRVFQTAEAPVLILFDEVLNLLNRYRGMAESFHAFIQNLTVAMTGTTHGAALISLPRSQVEMTDWDFQWQNKITKVVRRIAKDLIANDEAEISEVIRRRLFEDIGSERIRKNVSKSFADWCFENRAQLPREWTAVDTSTTEAKAREHLCNRFEACYPFHPATLSVFQRKWQALQQYQQTRGTLAMLAQWISIAARESFTKARKEPLITLGSAPLYDPGFRSIILGQLGESRLNTAIEADIAGEQSHAKALDADTKGPLREIHRRVATTILFESSGGQTEKVAHLPEIRFALGEKNIETTSIDNAAFALEDKAYFMRKVGTDGFRIGYKPTLKKVMSDRRASLDENSDIKPNMRKFVEGEFRKGATIQVVPFPDDGAEIPDTPKLTLVVADPEWEWTSNGELRKKISEWTKRRGDSPRLYPGALVWCVKKEGRELRDRVELWLAWKRVNKEMAEGLLGDEFDRSERMDLQTKVKDAEETIKDDIWGSYRYAVIYDGNQSDGLYVIDLGAGHSSSGETLCGRIISALRSEELLNESVGAGYIQRNWPTALKESGAWPMSSFRQSFLNGSLTRLIDPDRILKTKVVEFVHKGDFGLGSGQKSDGTYERLWYNEPVEPEEVTFDSGVYLLLMETAQKLKSGETSETPIHPEPQPEPEPSPQPSPESDKGVEPVSETQTRAIRIVGDIPPEIWNRLGTKLITKMRSGGNLKIGVDFEVLVKEQYAQNFIVELKQAIDDLSLGDRVRVE